MAYALLSDRLKMYLMAGETRLSVLMGGQSDGNPAMSRSALQNPELSRYELDCLLRHSASQSAPSLGWAGFFAGTAASCANSNAVAAEIA